MNLIRNNIEPNRKLRIAETAVMTVLLVAAILQLYTSHRIANELEKDTK